MGVIRDAFGEELLANLRVSGALVDSFEEGEDGYPAGDPMVQLVASIIALEQRIVRLEEGRTATAGDD